MSKGCKKKVSFWTLALALFEGKNDDDELTWEEKNEFTRCGRKHGGKRWRN